MWNIIAKLIDLLLTAIPLLIGFNYGKKENQKEVLDNVKAAEEARNAFRTDESIANRVRDKYSR